jgi:hypothetical protein
MKANYRTPCTRGDVIYPGDRIEKDPAGGWCHEVWNRGAVDYARAAYEQAEADGTHEYARREIERDQAAEEAKMAWEERGAVERIIRTDYPTAGAEFSARTGKSRFQAILDEAAIPEQHAAAVGLFANFILNTSPGYRPSDAARYAVRVYRQSGIEGVRAR